MKTLSTFNKVKDANASLRIRMIVLLVLFILILLVSPSLFAQSSAIAQINPFDTLSSNVVILGFGVYLLLRFLIKKLAQ
jgi:competence protein ComGC